MLERVQADRWSDKHCGTWCQLHFLCWRLLQGTDKRSGTCSLLSWERVRAESERETSNLYLSTCLSLIRSTAQMENRSLWNVTILAPVLVTHTPALCLCLLSIYFSIKHLWFESNDTRSAFVHWHPRVFMDFYTCLFACQHTSSNAPVTVQMLFNLHICLCVRAHVWAALCGRRLEDIFRRRLLICLTVSSCLLHAAGLHNHSHW